MENERILPNYTISGTAFIVDVEKDELRQVDNAKNVIPFSEMGYHRLYYDFHYDLRSHNIAEAITGSVQFTQVPNLTELDPLGMAIKYGKTELEVIGKPDVEVMIDQKQLALREGGQLPILEIAGHPFYVDIRLGSLRPKDDFSTMGIHFDDIEDYYLEDRKIYAIPYNPATHAIEQLDMDAIKAIPKGVVVVEIPLEQQLDPVAYARHYGFNSEHILRNYPLQMQMKARELSWNITPIKQIIAQNLKRDLKEQPSESLTKTKRKKGRGL